MTDGGQASVPSSANGWFRFLRFRRGHARGEQRRLLRDTLLAACDPVALAGFARRDLAGDNPFGADVLGSLTPLRQAVAEHRGTATEESLMDALALAARQGGWAAIGVWRFVAYFAPGSWRQDPRLREEFLNGLRQVAGELPHGLSYRADEVEEPLIRQSEPAGGPLWAFLPRRRQETVLPRRRNTDGRNADDRREGRHTDNAGRHARPAGPNELPDISIGERHLIATFGGNELLAMRNPDGSYVAMLARRKGTYDPRSVDEEFARAWSLVGLLTAVGQKIGQPGPTIWVSESLAPHLTPVMPEWW